MLPHHGDSRHVSFFLRAMEADAGQSQFLPFTCWCNGGKYRQAWHRQHRHMLLFSPVDHFTQNVWKKFQIPRKGRLFKNFYYIRMRRIKSPMILVNAMGYLGKSQSKCDSTFKKKDNVELKPNIFFYLYRHSCQFESHRLPTMGQRHQHHAAHSSGIPVHENRNSGSKPTSSRTKRVTGKLQSRIFRT